MRFLIHWSLRTEQLCADVRGCPLADTVTCRDCEVSRVPEDIRGPGTCPSCQSRRYRRERCDGCELQKLDEAMSSSAAGMLIMRVLEIDHALQMQMHVSLDDVTPEEFHALKILTSERNKKQQEDQEKSEREARMPMGHAIRHR